jgi:hypothetical protein
MIEISKGELIRGFRTPPALSPADINQHRGQCDELRRTKTFNISGSKFVDTTQFVAHKDRLIASNPNAENFQ